MMHAYILTYIHTPWHRHACIDACIHKIIHSYTHTHRGTHTHTCLCVCACGCCNPLAGAPTSMAQVAWGAVSNIVSCTMHGPAERDPLRARRASHRSKCRSRILAPAARRTKELTKHTYRRQLLNPPLVDLGPPGGGGLLRRKRDL